MLHLWIRLVYNCNVWIQPLPIPPILSFGIATACWARRTNTNSCWSMLEFHHCCHFRWRWNSNTDQQLLVFVRQGTVCDHLSGKARIESHGCPAITPSGKNNVLRTSVPHLIACWMMTNQWIADSEDQIMLTIPNIFRKGYWKARAHFHTISITHILIHAWTIPCKASV